MSQDSVDTGESELMQPSVRRDVRYEPLAQSDQQRFNSKPRFFPVNIKDKLKFSPQTLALPLSETLTLTFSMYLIIYTL